VGTGNKDPIYKALALSTQIVFWELCNSIDSSSSSLSLQTQSHYIKIAYKIRKVLELRSALTQQIAKSSGFRGLYRSICYLGRLRSAYNDIIHIVINLPSFRKLKIKPVPTQLRIPAMSCASSSVTFSKTFDILEIPLAKNNVKRYVHPTFTIAKVDSELKTVGLTKPRIHAEIQFICYLLQCNNLHDSDCNRM